MKIRKIGIFGGTFNPPHIGHLLMAESALDALSLDKVIFVPTGRIAYKNDSEIIEAKHRVNMLRLSVEANKNFDISTVETDNSDISYTADTLKYFKNLFSSERLYFIVGADSLDYMDKWKNPEEIFKLCSIAVVDRKNFESSIDDKIEMLKGRFNADIIKVPMSVIEISSSDIRRRFFNKRAVRYMMIPDVYNYIQRHHLYER